MRSLLVTGGAGFIGSNFVHYWLQQHPQDRLVVLDKLTYAGNLANLSGLEKYPHYSFVKGCINDAGLLTQLFAQYQFDTLINFAGESHVDHSIENSRIFIETNVMGVHTLLSVAKHYWLDQPHVAKHRFHHISTDEVFGSLQPEDAPFTEKHPYHTNSPYSASKAAADHLVRAFHTTYGLDITISHCSNNYGRYHFPEKLVPLSLVRILQGKTVSIYGDGKQVRDWLHVEDHCRGIEAILQRGQSGESYNIGGHDGEMTNLALMQQLCTQVDALFKEHPHYQQQFPLAPTASGRSAHQLIQHVKDRPGHDRRYAINSQKIQQELEFRYTKPIQQGLQETVRWYMDNPQWWQPLVAMSH